MSYCLEPEVSATGQSTLSMQNATTAAAFRSLYLEHFDRIYRLIVRYGIRSSDAEDLAQRVFLVVHRQGDISCIENPKAWVSAIAIRVIHEHFRYTRIRSAANWLLSHGIYGLSAVEQTPERDALADEQLSRVRKVLTQMSEKLRDALVLLDIEELSPREASELLGLPLNTLRSRRALARQQFRSLYEKLERKAGTEL